MNFQPGEPIFHDREQAREYLLKEILRPAPIFSTYPHGELVKYQIHVLRWLDCAPEGANFILAPLQGKDGRPCNAFANSENVGPNKALRAAREARGLNPFDGSLVPDGRTLKRSEWPELYDAIAHYADDHNALD